MRLRRYPLTRGDVISSETRELPCLLNDQDLLALTREVGQVQKRIRTLDAREARVKAMIKRLRERAEGRRDEILDIQAAGRQRQPVEVLVVLDLVGGRVYEVRSDTAEVLKEREATREDEQAERRSAPPSILYPEPQKPKAPPAAPPMEAEMVPEPEKPAEQPKASAAPAKVVHFLPLPPPPPPEVWRVTMVAPLDGWTLQLREDGWCFLFDGRPDLLPRTFGPFHWEDGFHPKEGIMLPGLGATVRAEILDLVGGSMGTREQLLGALEDAAEAYLESRKPSPPAAEPKPITWDDLICACLDCGHHYSAHMLSDGPVPEPEPCTVEGCGCKSYRGYGLGAVGHTPEPEKPAKRGRKSAPLFAEQPKASAAPADLMQVDGVTLSREERLILGMAAMPGMEPGVSAEEVRITIFPKMGPETGKAEAQKHLRALKLVKLLHNTGGRYKITKRGRELAEKLKPAETTKAAQQLAEKSAEPELKCFTCGHPPHKAGKCTGHPEWDEDGEEPCICGEDEAQTRSKATDQAPTKASKDAKGSKDTRAAGVPAEEVERLAPQALRWIGEAKDGLTEAGLAVNRGLGYDKATAVLEALKGQKLIEKVARRFRISKRGREVLEQTKPAETKAEQPEEDIDGEPDCHPERIELDPGFQGMDANGLAAIYYANSKEKRDKRAGEIYRYKGSMEGTTRTCERCEEATAPRALVSIARETYSSRSAKHPTGSSSFAVTVCSKCCHPVGIVEALEQRFAKNRAESAAREAQPAEPGERCEKTSPVTRIQCTLPVNHEGQHACHYRDMPTFWDDAPGREREVQDEAELVKVLGVLGFTLQEGGIGRTWVLGEERVAIGSGHAVWTVKGKGGNPITLASALDHARQRLEREQPKAAEPEKPATAPSNSNSTAAPGPDADAPTLGLKLPARDELRLSWGNGWGDLAGRRVFWLVGVPAGKGDREHVTRSRGPFWMDGPQLMCAVQEGPSGSLPKSGWRGVVELAQESRTQHYQDLPGSTWAMIQALGQTAELPGQVYQTVEAARPESEAPRLMLGRGALLPEIREAFGKNVVVRGYCERCQKENRVLCPVSAGQFGQVKAACLDCLTKAERGKTGDLRTALIAEAEAAATPAIEPTKTWPAVPPFPELAKDEKKRYPIEGCPGWFLALLEEETPEDTGPGPVPKVWNVWLELLTADEQTDFGPAGWVPIFSAIMPLRGDWILSESGKAALKAAEIMVAAGKVPELHPAAPSSSSATAPLFSEQTGTGAQDFQLDELNLKGYRALFAPDGSMMVSDWTGNRPEHLATLVKDERAGRLDFLHEYEESKLPKAALVAIEKAVAAGRLPWPRTAAEVRKAIGAQRAADLSGSPAEDPDEWTEQLGAAKIHQRQDPAGFRLYIEDGQGMHGPLLFDPVSTFLDAADTQDKPTMDWLDDQKPCLGVAERWCAKNLERLHPETGPADDGEKHEGAST